MATTIIFWREHKKMGGGGIKPSIVREVLSLHQLICFIAYDSISI
jgi:hypothetical protein